MLDEELSPQQRTASCAALAALTKDPARHGMELASAWLSRLLLHLSTDVKAHHSISQVRRAISSSPSIVVIGPQRFQFCSLILQGCWWVCLCCVQYSVLDALWQ